MTWTLNSVPPHTRQVSHLHWPQWRVEQSQSHPHFAGGDGVGMGGGRGL